MDFGTIRNNLENGTKYMDSEDVYKDVQYIWDNCFKYNNKGDYIVDLMKRVKKNFMKYWMAAGLYTEQTKKIKGEQILCPSPLLSLCLDFRAGYKYMIGASISLLPYPLILFLLTMKVIALLICL